MAKIEDDKSVSVWDIWLVWVRLLLENKLDPACPTSYHSMRDFGNCVFWGKDWQFKKKYSQIVLKYGDPKTKLGVKTRYEKTI